MRAKYEVWMNIDVKTFVVADSEDNAIEEVLVTIKRELGDNVVDLQESEAIEL